jgi:hypothetical protein
MVIIEILVMDMESSLIIFTENSIEIIGWIDGLQI